MAAYLKHPTLGNRHVDEADVVRLEGEGWVRWPRPKHVKTAAPMPADPVGPAQPKRRGRPAPPSSVDDLV